MHRTALVLLCLCACSKKAHPPERGGPSSSPPDAARAVAGIVPDAAPPALAPTDAAPGPACVPGGDALAVTLQGTKAIVCAGSDARCIAVADDGTITDSLPPEEPFEATEGTIADDAASAEFCRNDGDCTTFAPKPAHGASVAKAWASPSGPYVLLDVYGEYGDPSWVEVWSSTTGKLVASQKLPFNDDEGESIHVAWAGALVVVYVQPGPQIPGRGTVYKLAGSKLAKVQALPGLTAWTVLDDQALFVVADGPKILAFDHATGKARPTIDASWLLHDGDVMEGVYALSAADGRIAVVADASIYDDAWARLGLITVATGAHVEVDVPICATR